MTITTTDAARKVIRNLASQDHATGQSERWALEVDSRKAIDRWRADAAEAGDLAICEAIDLLDSEGGPNGDAACEYEHAVSAICYDEDPGSR